MGCSVANMYWIKGTGITLHHRHVSQGSRQGLLEGHCTHKWLLWAYLPCTVKSQVSEGVCEAEGPLITSLIQVGIGLLEPCPRGFRKSVIFPSEASSCGRGSSEGNWKKGLENHCSGAAFAMVHYCSSFEGCKHLLGTKAALLSMRKLGSFHRLHRTSCEQNAMSFESDWHLLPERPFLVKPGLPWAAGKHRVLWLLESPFSPGALHLELLALEQQSQSEVAANV